MFGCLGHHRLPEEFKMNAHRKIGDHFSSYCENITRRAKAEGRVLKGQQLPMWQNTDSLTFNSLWNTKHSPDAAKYRTSKIHNVHSKATFTSSLALHLRPVEAGDAVGLPMQRAQPEKLNLAQLVPRTQHNIIWQGAICTTKDETAEKILSLSIINCCVWQNSVFGI